MDFFAYGGPLRPDVLLFGWGSPSAPRNQQIFAATQNRLPRYPANAARLPVRPPRPSLRRASAHSACSSARLSACCRLRQAPASHGGPLIPSSSPSVRASPWKSLRKGRAERSSSGLLSALHQNIDKSTMIVNALPAPSLQSISDTIRKMGQSSQSKIYSFDPVLQQEILIGEQILLGKASFIRQSFKEQITQDAQINELLVYFSPLKTNSSEKVLEYLRKHVNIAHLSHVSSRFYNKFNSIVIDENQLNQMYVINNENTLSLISYRLSVVQLSNEEKLFLIFFTVEKIPINEKSLPVTLAFLEEAAPLNDNLSQQILENTEFIEDIRT